MLAPTLPTGIEMHVDMHASDVGTYRFGGGWITRGDLYLGRHTTPTDTIKVVSSNVHVLTAEIVPNPTDPNRQWVKLTTLTPGKVRLTFQALKVDKNRQPLFVVGTFTASLHRDRQPFRPLDAVLSRLRENLTPRSSRMDAMFLLLTLAFFAASAVLVYGFERLRQPS